MKSPDIATTLIAITFIICCTLLSLKGCNRNIGDELKENSCDKYGIGNTSHL